MEEGEEANEEEGKRKGEGAGELLRRLADAPAEESKRGAARAARAAVGCAGSTEPVRLGAAAARSSIWERLARRRLRACIRSAWVSDARSAAKSNGICCSAGGERRSDMGVGRREWRAVTGKGHAPLKRKVDNACVRSRRLWSRREGAVHGTMSRESELQEAGVVESKARHRRRSEREEGSKGQETTGRAKLKKQWELRRSDLVVRRI